MRIALLLMLCAGAAPAQNATELWLRGYTAVPTPRNVRLAGGDVAFGAGWRLDAGRVGENHIAARTLLKDAAEFHHIDLRAGGKAVRLAVAPGAVAAGNEQGYRLSISDAAIEITGNGDAGLFYGVQTLLQLMKTEDGRTVLPAGVIEDWPALELRFLHWDTKHHQDRISTLKRYIDWAARFKANMIGFELEDKFEYPSHPVIGAPGAFTTAELQEITDYALERFIQVVPEIQSPAHMAYVLKHPEFAHLRADGNNYQSKLCDPRTYDLIFSMYDDVIKANRGVKYFFVSTDEVYYAGIEGCRPYTPENRSLAWVEFVRRAREHLARQGRRILVWAEYPLLPQHVSMIPPDVIDGVIGEPEYIPIEKKLGMRQLAYVSMQGGEFLFPDHFSRLPQAAASIAHGRHWQGNPIGAFGAAWDDSGLHNETFWLGWSAVAQYAWNPGAAPVPQHIAEFMRLYYGPRAQGMIDVYRMLQQQAQGWGRTWDRVTSRVRGPGYGNSYGKGRGTERRDMTLAAPALPAMPDLALKPVFGEKYAKFIAEARERIPENERCVLALHDNLGRVDRNHYNLEVYLALANFMGHHWRLLAGLADAEKRLETARQSEPRIAVGHMVAAHNAVENLRKQGEEIFAGLTAVYEKSRFPKGRSVGGRKFVHILDDTKDHWADRTPDLGFMAAPERSIGLEKWAKDLSTVIHAYAALHKIPVKGLGEARLEE
ncbi:MAG: beta-N-acetylhexosaminidase [Bryobacteraceae bacterium]